MRRRWIWAGVVVAAVGLAGAGLYVTRTQTAAQPQRPRDPGFLLILSIRTLERAPETRLSKEQIARILPFVKALKDVPPSDEAGVIIARAVRETFTPEQRAALEEARRRFQERQQAGAPGAGGEGAGPGPGGVPGAGAGVGPAAAISDEQRAQFRQRAFERMIRALERRMR